MVVLGVGEETLLDVCIVEYVYVYIARKGWEVWW